MKKVKKVDPEISEIASRLGKLARGVPKHFSKAERKRRSLRLAEARKRRWLDRVS